MFLHLYIKNINNPYHLDQPKSVSQDNAGYDIHVPSNITIPARAMGFKIHLGIATECRRINYETNSLTDMIIKQSKLISYQLVPRSSISKTPLRMSNSIGIIDSSYRGELIFCVDNQSDDDFTVLAGQRLCQLVFPALEPLSRVFVVDELSESERGAGGFGSTGV